MSDELTAGQLEAAATVLMLDGAWRSQRWLVRSLPGSNFDRKWAVVKRMIADGLLEAAYDNYGTDLLKLAKRD
jgi:hypothetical protein